MTDLLLGSEELEVFSKSKLNYWVGERPPLPGFVASNDVLSADDNFRLHADMHGSFDGVFYLEHDLGRAKQWRLILDELLRLTDGTGALVVRYTPGPYFGTHELMHAIRSWANGNVEVTFSRRWKDDFSRVVGFSFSTEPRVRTFDSVTFGVIVDGRSPDRLARFIDSVEDIDGLTEIDFEILVCGPADALAQLDRPTDNVRLVEQDLQFSQQGWITRKKNKLVNEAAGGLIVLAHDRYSFLPDFLTQLKAYGPDFDVLIPQQKTEAGARYPSLVATSGHWDISAVAELEQGDFLPTIYINGGILIAHTEVLRNTPYNELLFWADAEDVELTRRLSFSGVVPRFSNEVTVLTDVTRSDQISVFQRLPYVGQYLVPSLDDAFYEVGSWLEFDGLTRAAQLQDAGLILPRSWSPTDRGLRWLGSEMPEFSVRPAFSQSTVNTEWTLTVCLHGAPFASERLEILVNGNRARLRSVERRGDLDELTFALPEELVAPSHTFLIQFANGLPASSTLKKLSLGRETEILSLPLKLRFTRTALPPAVELRGWAEFEATGIWTVGRSSAIRIPAIQSNPGHDLRMNFSVEPFLNSSGEQRLVVFVNDSPREIWTFSNREKTTRVLTVPAMTAEQGLIDIRFETAWPTAPADIGLSPDPRKLGIFLSKLSISETPQASGPR